MVPITPPSLPRTSMCHVRCSSRGRMIGWDWEAGRAITLHRLLGFTPTGAATSGGRRHHLTASTALASVEVRLIQPMVSVGIGTQGGKPWVCKVPGSRLTLWRFSLTPKKWPDFIPSVAVAVVSRIIEARITCPRQETAAFQGFLPMLQAVWQGETYGQTSCFTC